MEQFFFLLSNRLKNAKFVQNASTLDFVLSQIVLKTHFTVDITSVASLPQDLSLPSGFSPKCMTYECPISPMRSVSETLCFLIV
jgi:hypothetical protein